MPIYEQIYVLTIISSKQNEKRLTAFLNNNGCNIHVGFLGRGTAEDEVSAFMGLGETEKVVVFIFLPNEKCKEIMQKLKNEFVGGLHGLACSIKVSSMDSTRIMSYICE